MKLLCFCCVLLYIVLNTLAYVEIKPSTAIPLPLEIQSSVTRQPSATGVSTQETTKKPLVTIEPPGNKLSRKCIQSKGLFPTDSCNKYVNCWEGVAIEQICPDGLLFNPLKLYCDYAVNVICQGKPITAVNLKTENSECPLIFGNFRNKRNCSQYYTCVHYKIAAKYQCPKGFSFSDLLGICDYSYRVDCRKEPQIFTKYAPKRRDSFTFKAFAPEVSQPVTSFPFNAYAHPDLLIPANFDDRQCLVSEGIVRDRKNCSIYYVCKQGEVFATYVCPKGYRFSNELGRCDPEEKVNCENVTRKMDVGADTLTAPNIPEGFPFNAYAHSDLSKPGRSFPFNAYAYPELSKLDTYEGGMKSVIPDSKFKLKLPTKM